MNLPLASLIVLVYFNLVWQIMLWSYNYLHPVLGFVLVIFFPVFAGIALYIVLESRLPEPLVIPLLVSTILFPIIYGVSHMTRLPDYIKYVQHGGGSFFDGRVSEIDGGPYLYYTLENAEVRPEEFGASYDSVRPRQSTTTYYKYFALPVFDANTRVSSNLFVCGSIRSGLHIDNGAGGTYGLSETDLPRVFGTGPLRARKTIESNCRRAAVNYYGKTGAAMNAEPVILEIHNETATEYYRVALIHFWAFTALLNALFITLFAFVYRANRSV